MAERASTDQVAGEIGYLRGLLAAIKTAPGTVDPGQFADRLGRAVTALEAVRVKAAWAVALTPPRNSTGVTDGITVGTRVLGEEILREMAKALSGEAPAGERAPL